MMKAMRGEGRRCRGRGGRGPCPQSLARYKACLKMGSRRGAGNRKLQPSPSWARRLSLAGGRTGRRRGSGGGRRGTYGPGWRRPRARARVEKERRGAKSPSKKEAKPQVKAAEACKEGGNPRENCSGRTRAGPGRRQGEAVEEGGGVAAEGGGRGQEGCGTERRRGRGDALRRRRRLTQNGRPEERSQEDRIE